MGWLTRYAADSGAVASLPAPLRLMPSVSQTDYVATNRRRSRNQVPVTNFVDDPEPEDAEAPIWRFVELWKLAARGGSSTGC